MKRNKIKKRSPVGIADFPAVLLAAATLLGLLGRLHWTLDLLSHFRVQYMQIGLILIGVSIWMRQHKRTAALILLAAFNYAFVLPFYFGSPSPAIKTPVRAMLLNLNAQNGNTQKVLEAIRDADPDLLLLEEVTPEWADKLTVLNPDYPHRIEEPRKGSFGIMLLARYPLEHREVMTFAGSGGPSVLAEAYLPQGTVSIIGTHPVPPLSRSFAERRNLHFAELAEAVLKQPHPVLLIGDLNTSPWSPHFRDLAEASGLRNSMKGFGFQPSWPVGKPFLKIPIDHMLHAPEIIIHNRAVLGDVGSDHYPVVVDFSLRQLF